MRLFLSYNSVDRPSVVAAQKLLEGRGITTFLDRDHLVPGLPWPQRLEEGLRDVSAVAVFVGRELGGWQKREMWFALDRQVREEKHGLPFPVIPVLLPGADLAPSFLFSNTWIDLRCGVEGLAAAEPLDAFERAMNATAAAAATDRAVAVCPYRGLEPFREDDAAFFAGRGALARQLLNFTLGKDLVVVVGPSGSGKSSVVQAGLVPLLRRRFPPAITWDAVAFTPGSEPFHRLATALIPQLEPGMSERERLAEAEALAKDLYSGRTRIESVVGRVIEKSNGTGRLLIVADQFEELLTLTPEPNRRPFAQALLSALGKARFTLLVTLRADFYSQVITLHRELSDRLAPAQVNIGALTRDELRETITTPAGLVGVKFEPGLLDRILDDVGNEPGNLPLLEFALAGLWSKRQDRSLTNAAYNEIGGVTGALAQRAEAEFLRFTPAEQAATRRLFSRLVRVARPEEGAEDTRLRLNLETTDALAGKVALTLAGPEVRLLVMGYTERLEQIGSRTVEVAHEALIRNWERLRTWLNEDREFLLWRQRIQNQMELWEEHQRDADFLLRGTQLSEAERWLIVRPHDLVAAVQEFLKRGIDLKEQQREESERKRQEEIDNAKRLKEAAEARAEAEQKLGKRAQLVIVGLLFAALAFGGLSVWAWFQKDEAEKARRESAIQRTLGIWQSAAREAALDAILHSNDDRTALLARQAMLFHRTTPTQPRYLVEDALQASAQQPFFSHVLSSPLYDVRSVAFSPDGSRLALAGGDGTVRLWDLREPQAAPQVLSGNQHALYSVAFSPDGRRLASAGEEGTVCLWNLRRPQASPQVLPSDHFDVTSIAFSSDSRHLAWGNNAGTARLWDVRRPKAEPQTLSSHEGGVHSVAFSHDGVHLAWASTEGVRVWDIRRPKAELRILSSHRGSVNSVAFSHDGTRLASGSADGAVLLWDLRQPQAAPQLSFPGGGPIFSVAFSPDSTRLVSAGAEGAVLLWDLRQPQAAPQVLFGHHGSIFSVAFSPDGTRVASASSDRTVRLWELSQPQAAPRFLLGNQGTAGSVTVSSTGWAVTYGGVRGLKSVTLSPDGALLACVDTNESVGLWDLRGPQGSLESPQILFANRTRVNSVAFSFDGAHLASASLDGTVRLWDLHQPQAAPQVLSGHLGSVSSVAFSADSTLLASAAYEGNVELWDLRRPQASPKVLSGHQAGRNSMAFSPDGAHLASTSVDGTVRLWDLHRPQATPLALSGPEGFISSIAFSPDSMLLASAGYKGTVELWDLRRPQASPQVLSGHQAGVNSMAFSSDGAHLASASLDGTVRLWDLHQPQAAPLVLSGRQGFISSIAFSLDSTRLFSASDSGTVLVWPLWTAAADYLCTRVWRNLSMEEWRFYIGVGIPYERTCPNLPSGDGAPR
jgi:WD40 repeat protein